jgi:hypothetical protein
MQVNEKGGSPPKLAVVTYCRFKSIYRFDLAEELIMRALDAVLVKIHLELLPGKVSFADSDRG